MTQTKTALCPWCKSNIFEVGIIKCVTENSTAIILYGKHLNQFSSENLITDSYVLCNECKQAISITAHELESHYIRDQQLKRLEKRLLTK